MVRISEDNLVRILRETCTVCGKERAMVNLERQPVATHVRTERHQKALARLRVLQWPE